MAGEHGKAQAGLRLWTQDAKEEWMIDHKGDWGWRRWTDDGALFMNLEDGNCNSFCPLLVNLQGEKIKWSTIGFPTFV